MAVAVYFMLLLSGLVADLPPLRPVANHFHRTGWPPRCSLKHTATAAECMRYYNSPYLK